MVDGLVSRKVIIIGGSSGIGRALARVFAAEGYVVGITGRRAALLREVAEAGPGVMHVMEMDVTNVALAVAGLERLMAEMGGVDVVVVNAGTGFINPALEWDLEQVTIETNVVGFAALAGAAMRYFLEKGSGQLVGISSIASIRGSEDSPAYNASKAFMSNYLEGLRKRAMRARLAIRVTDIQPGFVDTAMAKGDGLFWVASPEKAAAQIFSAIQLGRRRAYVTRRWGLVAWVLRVLPDWVFERMVG